MCIIYSYGYIHILLAQLVLLYWGALPYGNAAGAGLRGMLGTGKADGCSLGTAKPGMGPQSRENHGKMVVEWDVNGF